MPGQPRDSGPDHKQAKPNVLRKSCGDITGSRNRNGLLIQSLLD